MKKRKISFGELKLGPKVDAYWKRIRDTNWVSMGPLVEEFEEKFANLFGAKHAIAVSNGTDADINALLSLYQTHNARLGDEIICPALCFFSVASSIVAAGFKPVFVDVSADTLNIDPFKIEEKITNRTRAILAVNTMGTPVDIPVLKYITKKHNLAFIIDNCEGHGCKYLNEHMEYWADLVTYSCYQAHLVQSAEYGFVCTNNDELAEIIRCTRTHGREGGKNSFNHIYLGYNSKPTDLHSMIGLSQIDEFWERFDKRVANVERMQRGLADYKQYIRFNPEPNNNIGNVNSPHAFSITLKDPRYNIKEFKKHLTYYLIDWKLNFLSIPTQQKAFIDLVGRNGFQINAYPVAENVGGLGIHFGCHEHLTTTDCDYIVDVIKLYFENEMWIKESANGS